MYYPKPKVPNYDQEGIKEYTDQPNDCIVDAYYESEKQRTGEYPKYHMIVCNCKKCKRYTL